MKLIFTLNSSLPQAKTNFLNRISTLYKIEIEAEEYFMVDISMNKDYILDLIKDSTDLYFVYRENDLEDSDIELIIETSSTVYSSILKEEDLVGRYEFLYSSLSNFISNPKIIQYLLKEIS